MHGQGLGIWKEPGLRSLSESSVGPNKSTPHTGTPGWSPEGFSESDGKVTL